MLNGIKIIEIEGIGPGPFAGMMLADMGADVVKVERPEGDASRRMVPPHREWRERRVPDDEPQQARRGF